MSSDRRIQQGIPSPQSPRRQFLRHESNAKKIHLKHPEIIHNLERKKHLVPIKPPIHSAPKPRILDHKLRMLHPRL